MGIGSGFMNFARGWNRYASGIGHKIKGGAKYYWNGGDHPSVDDWESMVGRIEGGQEYYYGKDLTDAGEQGMGSGIGEMWDGIAGEPAPARGSESDDGAGGAGPSSQGGGASGGGADAGPIAGPEAEPEPESDDD